MSAKGLKYDLKVQGGESCCFDMVLRETKLATLKENGEEKYFGRMWDKEVARQLKKSQDEYGVLNKLQGVIGCPKVLAGWVGKQNKEYYIMMENAGEGLMDWAKRRIITDGDLKMLAEKLSATLQGMHARGIIHCDVK